MRFLIDESVDGPITTLLRWENYVVEDIKEISPGIKDEKVLKRAEDTKAILITEDKDFGELVFRFKMANHGVVLIRLDNMENPKKAQIVLRSIQTIEERIPNSFVVIRENKVRIRPLK